MEIMPRHKLIHDFLFLWPKLSFILGIFFSCSFYYVLIISVSHEKLVL